MENEAKEEEAKDKEIKAEIVRKTSLKKRMGMTGMSGTASATGAGDAVKKDSSGNGGSKAGAGVAERQLSGVQEEQNENEDEVLADEESERARTEGIDMEARGRASEYYPCSHSGRE